MFYNIFLLDPARRGLKDSKVGRRKGVLVKQTTSSDRKASETNRMLSNGL